MDSIIEKSGAVIVGFSGGADSSCLLRLLCDRYSGTRVKLVAAHVNHMIRGEEADRDEEFCRKTAEGLNVPFYSVRCDVPAYAKENGMGLEEAARNIRYAFFGDISEKLTAKRDGVVIATAHNSSDNLESVIMNMLRGAGLHGMSGISPIRDGRIIRPLIKDSGEDIRDWCRENGVDYVIDRTNSETDCTRNYIRHKIVPLMREICSSPENQITRMTSLLREDDAFLDNEAKSLIDTGRIDRRLLNGSVKAVASRAVMCLYSMQRENDGTLSEGHIADILRAASEKDGYSEISVPGNMKTIIDRDAVYFVRNDTDKENCSETVFEYSGGEATFDNGLWKLSFSDTLPEKAKNIGDITLLRSFDYDKIKGTIKIRYKVDGDSYVYGGHTHKVKKIFTDAKLSEREKNLTPLIMDDNGIVYIPGFRTRDGMRWSEETGHRVIYLLCERNSH